MKDVIEYVKELEKRGERVENIISCLSGWMDAYAKSCPDKTYTAAEVAELFSLLFEIRIEQISRRD